MENLKQIQDSQYQYQQLSFNLNFNDILNNIISLTIPLISYVGIIFI